MPCRGPEPWQLCQATDENGNVCGKDLGHTSRHSWQNQQCNAVVNGQRCVLATGHEGSCIEHEKYRFPKEESPELRDELKIQITPEQLLCSACRVLDRLGYDFGENPALDQFWDHHKKIDASE